MKRLISIVFIISAFVITSCQSKYDVYKYHSKAEADSLLTDIITYAYIKPKDATGDTRFDSKYRPYYIQQLPKFKFEQYFVDDKGVHFFFVIRPARSAQGNTRGVIGTFRIMNDKMISFREIINTPVADVETLQNRGEELFNNLVRRGNINDYLKHPDYVEWPDEITFYDTIKNEWLVKPGL